MKPNAKQKVPTRRSSDVKGHRREIVEQANAMGEVVLTNYSRPEVVVVSMDRYAELKEDAAAHDPLAVLRAEFDRQLSVLSAPGGAKKLRQAFAASPAEISKAATAARRKR